MQLLHALGLKESVWHLNEFSYADADFRPAFLREGPTDVEALKVLAHEKGHICCGHMERAGLIEQNVEEEFEAAAFA